VIDRDAEHTAGIRRLAVEPGHSMFEQYVHTGLERRGVERPHQTGTSSDFLIVRIGRSAGMDHRPVLDRYLHGAQHRDPDLMSDAVRPPVDDLHAMREQEFESRHAIVGEGADDLAVIVAIRRKAIGLNHRPIG